VIGLALALAVALAAASEPNDLGSRLSASAAAAQALLGPLDGGWTLSDARGRPLFALQITDPATGATPREGAWRDLAGTGETGPVDTIERRGDRLSIRFVHGRDAVWIRLRRRGDGAWAGEATDSHRVFQVALHRSH
jgi:hypothetical protein